MGNPNSRGKKAESSSNANHAHNHNPFRYVVAAFFLTTAVFLLGRRPNLPAESRVAKAAVNPIRQISILGERNSGTRWTYEYVLYILSLPSVVCTSAFSHGNGFLGRLAVVTPTFATEYRLHEVFPKGIFDSFFMYLFLHFSSRAHVCFLVCCRSHRTQQ